MNGVALTRVRKGLLYLLRFLLRRPVSLLGWAIVFLLFIVMILAPLIAPYDPEAASREVLKPPSLAHPFGTDRSGMDVFSRVIYATRIDIPIALLCTFIAIVVGWPTGVLAGYFRTTIAELYMRFLDTIHSFPIFILALAIMALTGQKLQNIIYTIGILSIPTYARLGRSQAIFLRERPFVEAARAIGNKEWRIALRHVLPNSLTPLYIQASITIGVVMFLTAGISFVGAGVRAPTPEWGSMINIGAGNIMTGEWWPSIFPGIALMFSVLGFALVGDSLHWLLQAKRV